MRNRGVCGRANIRLIFSLSNSPGRFNLEDMILIANENFDEDGFATTFFSRDNLPGSAWQSSRDRFARPFGPRLGRNIIFTGP